jgi:hypothetical protein
MGLTGVQQTSVFPNPLVLGVRYNEQARNQALTITFIFL